MREALYIPHKLESFTYLLLASLCGLYRLFQVARFASATFYGAGRAGFSPHSIIGRVFVTLRAMCGGGVLSYKVISAQGIDALRDRLEVARVYTVPSTAQMIAMKVQRQLRIYKHLVHNTAYYLGNAFTRRAWYQPFNADIHSGVAESVGVSNPIPARKSVMEMGFAYC